jgi:hypothetical protein
MGVYNWGLRCVPGWTIVLLVILVECSLGLGESTYRFFYHLPPQSPYFNPLIPQIIFSCYTLLLHTIALVFPLRLARACSVATRAIKHHHGRAEPPPSTDGRRIVMAIVIPAYKESVDTMRETLDVLASHEGAPHSYDVRQELRSPHRS